MPAAAVLLVAAVTASGADATTVWFVIRAAGIVAYLLLTASLIAGLLVTNRVLPAGQPRLDLFEVHAFLSLLVLGFGTFHALALLLDTYVGFSPLQVLVPLTSSYRPAAVSLGILTLYLSIVVYGSFWARRLIGYRAWRALHYGSFAVFALATYHGILSGADTSAPWMIAIYLGAITSVLALLLVRVLVEMDAQERKAAAAKGGGPRAPISEALPAFAEADFDRRLWGPPKTSD